MQQHLIWNKNNMQQLRRDLIKKGWSTIKCKNLTDIKLISKNFINELKNFFPEKLYIRFVDDVTKIILLNGLELIKIYDSIFF